VIAISQSSQRSSTPSQLENKWNITSLFVVVFARHSFLLSRTIRDGLNLLIFIGLSTIQTRMTRLITRVLELLMNTKDHGR
jgi:hypothetical protein